MSRDAIDAAEIFTIRARAATPAILRDIGSTAYRNVDARVAYMPSGAAMISFLAIDATPRVENMPAVEERCSLAFMLCTSLEVRTRATMVTRQPQHFAASHDAGRAGQRSAFNDVNRPFNASSRSFTPDDIRKYHHDDNRRPAHAWFAGHEAARRRAGARRYEVMGHDAALPRPRHTYCRYYMIDDFAKERHAREPCCRCKIYDEKEMISGAPGPTLTRSCKISNTPIAAQKLVYFGASAAIISLLFAGYHAAATMHAIYYITLHTLDAASVLFHI